MLTAQDMLAALDRPNVKLTLAKMGREKPSPGKTSRHGEGSGATWIDWHRMMDKGADIPMFLPPEEVLQVCAGAGISEESEVYLYCFKGARAANTMVALREAGIRHVRLYFGSWNEWSRDQSLPIDEGPLPAQTTPPA
jgi:thiosulfate/3-mercaptopyruvate sulfurtransferase